jgi:hypothetical protein
MEPQRDSLKVNPLVTSSRPRERLRSQQDRSSSARPVEWRGPRTEGRLCGLATDLNASALQEYDSNHRGSRRKFPAHSRGTP